LLILRRQAALLATFVDERPTEENNDRSAGHFQRTRPIRSSSGLTAPPVSDYSIRIRAQFALGSPGGVVIE